MPTIEQFRDSDLSQLYTKQYADDPLSYQSAMLTMLCLEGVLRQEDADIMALQFYAPLYMLLTLCDRQPEREAEALQLLERHIRQFNRIINHNKRENHKIVLIHGQIPGSTYHIGKKNLIKLKKKKK
jgi:hypothetical protein